MNTENAAEIQNETSQNDAKALAASWGRPEASAPKAPASRLKLELSAEAPKAKRVGGKVVSTFKLREESEMEIEPQSRLLARRANFKSIFEAGVNR